MGTNCAPLLADLFLYSYESEFLQKLVKDKKIHGPVSQMKMTFQEIRIIATGSCIANQLRDVNTICRRSWYIDDSGQLSTKIYDKRDDLNFKIINFPNMCSNIPASPAYGVNISQLIRYARASSNYSDLGKVVVKAVPSPVKQMSKTIYLTH
jgi:hypothetical protein